MFFLYKDSLQKNGESKYFQFLVPRSLKKEVLGEVHNVVMGGHFGCRKTLEKVKIKYYWYEIKMTLIAGCYLMINVPQTKLHINYQ